jgi:hypothetical protein
VARRIKVKAPSRRPIKVVALPTRKISGEEVAHALGAEPAGSTILSALRHNLVTALKSTGGRPGLEGAVRRQKIPMGDQDWEGLQKIAESLATEEAAPTAGQVAAQLLHDALQSLAETPKTDVVLTVKERSSSSSTRSCRRRIVGGQRLRPEGESRESGACFFDSSARGLASSGPRPRSEWPEPPSRRWIAGRRQSSLRRHWQQHSSRHTPRPSRRAGLRRAGRRCGG